MGYNTFERISDQLLSADDKYVLKTSIQWFLRLLDHNIPLTEDAFAFCLLTLNDKAPSFVDTARALVARHGGMKIDPEKMKELLSSFDEILDDHVMLADHLDTCIKKGGATLARPVAKAMYRALEERLADFAGCQMSNLEQQQRALKDFFRLDDVEASVATAVYLLENWSRLDDYFNTHLSCRERGKYKILSTMLGIPHRDFLKALSGKLSQLELVCHSCDTLSPDVMVDSLFTCPLESVESLFYTETKKDILPLDYFPLAEGVAEHLLSLLGRDNQTPTHILLYGPPGTGKTSFAAAAAHALGQPAYYVSTPKDGDIRNRKKALEACLNISGGGKDALVIVDEADALINTEASSERHDKGWFNEFLERPGIRTLWVTNTISEIPESIMRRFAYSVNFQKLGREQRINIWNHVVANNKVFSLISQDEIKRFAVEYPLSAGSIDLAVKKSREIAGRKKRLFIQALERSLKASRQLINGIHAISQDDAIESEYSLEGLNLEADTSTLMRQLEAFNAHLNSDSKLRVNMNLLFYGPPGTGKTEMSRYLSRQLKRELMVRRTSDILSMWLGQSEKQIARAFQEAERERAVLVIDEADSLLFSRDKAVHSWETSMVNEFLTQMEHFRGLLICTTNRLEELDAASLRRFNHKIRFDFLTIEGNLVFYERMLRPLAAGPASDEVLLPLRRLPNLTPGDFKIVRDRFAFFPKNKVRHEDLVQGLVGESGIKGAAGKRRTIGF